MAGNSTTPAAQVLYGRGSHLNPVQRFTELRMDYDPGEEPGRVATKVYLDHSSSIISRNDSPDLGMTVGLNPYRGCEHGCAYCYARPYHEYLGFGSGVDFESRIMVKKDAAALLKKAISKPGYKPVCLNISGITDCYQPLEKKLRITRSCLEVLAQTRHPTAIITKNFLVTRDIDLLEELAKHQAVMVYISVTSLDAGLAHKLEPRASSPNQRLEAIRLLHDAGIPVGVSTAPVIPGLNDHELPSILQAAADAGACSAFYTVVRLPFGVKEVFAQWLDAHFPDRKDKILGRIVESQGQTMSHPEFGKRMSGVGVWAEQIALLFEAGLRRSGLAQRQRPVISCAAFRRPLEQMELGLL